MPMLCMLYKDMHYGYLVKKICFNLCVHICSRNTGMSPSHCLLEFATICVGGPVHFLRHHTPHDGYKQFWFLKASAAQDLVGTNARDTRDLVGESTMRCLLHSYWAVPHMPSETKMRTSSADWVPVTF